jgi:hypothetical protein
MLNQESLDKLDAGFDTARETENVEMVDAMNLLNKAVQGASIEDDKDVAKKRLQRLYCFSNEIKKVLCDDEDSDETGIRLPKDMLEAIQKDVEGDLPNIIPVSAAIDAINKKFVSAPVEKNENTEEVPEEEIPEYATSVDLNEETFDVNGVDWGPDPDFTVV